MARGFESKDVEFQQTEAANRASPPARALTPEERERQSRRHTIELALTKARADRAAASHPHHRHSLDQAIRALEEQLSAIDVQT